MKNKRTKMKGFPATCLFLSVLLFLLAALLMYGWMLDLQDKKELYLVSGLVDSFEQTNTPRAGRKMHVYLRGESKNHHLTQEDLTKSFPALFSLKKGDKIDALVAIDCCFRDLEWIWEIRRDNETILTYENSVEALMIAEKKNYVLGQWVGVVAFLFLLTGIAYRVKFGAWKS